MAHPVDFIGTNVVMKAPAGAENVNDARAFRNDHCCVTCWQLTPSEIVEVVETGRVYLSIHFGGTMPPAFVGGEDAVREITADYGGTFPKQPVTHES